MDTQSEWKDHVIKGHYTEGQRQTLASSEMCPGLTVVQQKWSKLKLYFLTELIICIFYWTTYASISYDLIVFPNFAFLLKNIY